MYIQSLHTSFPARLAALRCPNDRLKLQFEALSHLNDKEREATETMIAGVLHMHDATRWTPAASTALAAKPKARKAVAR